MALFLHYWIQACLTPPCGQVGATGEDTGHVQWPVPRHPGQTSVAETWVCYRNSRLPPPSATRPSPRCYPARAMPSIRTTKRKEIHEQAT